MDPAEIMVEPILRSDAVPWVTLRHYSRKMGNSSFTFGAFLDGVLVGVCTYGVTASPTLCSNICGPEWRDNVVELTRVVCEPIKNLASILVGRSLAMLPKPKIVVSFADTAFGHIGYIYQATNWLYTGETGTSWEYDAGNKHSRNCKPGTKSRKRSSKHRYVYFCADRGIKRELLERLKWRPQAYPKGNTTRHDEIHAVARQIQLL